MAGCMSIRRYLKSIDGVPDSKGSLSTTIPSAAIPSANIIGRIDISLNLVGILPVTVQRIDVVTSHTASHRSLSYTDGTIAQSAYYLWRMYNYTSHDIIFVKFFIRKFFTQKFTIWKLRNIAMFHLLPTLSALASCWLGLHRHRRSISLRSDITGNHCFLNFGFTL